MWQGKKVRFRRTYGATVPKAFGTGGKGITLPLVHPIVKPGYVGFYLHAFGFGGKGIRTPGLLIANETLYQLSYTPSTASENYHDAKICQQGKRPLKVQVASVQQSKASGQAHVNTWRFGISRLIEAHA